jgi:hypothetical protein
MVRKLWVKKNSGKNFLGIAYKDIDSLGSIGRLSVERSSEDIWIYVCAPEDAYIEKRIFGIGLPEKCRGQIFLGKFFCGIAYKDINGLQSVGRVDGFCGGSEGSSAGRQSVERINNNKWIVWIGSDRDMEVWQSIFRFR